MKALSAGLCLMCVIGSVPTSLAHDLQGLVVERTSLDPETRARLEEITQLRRLLAAQAAASPRMGNLRPSCSKHCGGQTTR